MCCLKPGQDSLNMNTQLGNEGWQHGPLQNVLLWYKGYFELKAIKNKQIEETLVLSQFA